MDKRELMITRSSFWSNLFKSASEEADLEEVLKSMPPFQKLSRKYIRLLLEIMHNRVYQKGEYIFYEGDPGIGLYIIREGEVVIRQENGTGIEQDLTTLSRGDFFGELAMLDNEIRSASAIATEDTSVAVIFKPDLDEFIDKYPSKGVHILRGLATMITVRLRRLNDQFSKLTEEFIKLQGEKNATDK
ncbi:MAG: cyclic nucleotide-binding domain-containing protein [Ignavibacteria bacterium]|nr:MAG: cyclic nucleotide-binding domain-containing protein [Ignavibacteria bacterium]